MNNILSKYQTSGHFFFNIEDELKKVCNAPEDKSGVYIIYSVVKDKEDIIYIGASGKMKQDGKISHRKGGLKDRLVNGHQFGQKRYKSWKVQMKNDKISVIKIGWWVTYSESIKHIPKYTEAVLLQEYFEKHNKLPKWNKIY